MSMIFNILDIQVRFIVDTFTVLVFCFLCAVLRFTLLLLGNTDDRKQFIEMSTKCTVSDYQHTHVGSI